MCGRDAYPTHANTSRSEQPTLHIMQYETLTHKIIGCAMKVHNALHSGFQEVIYQRARAALANPTDSLKQE